MPPCTSPCERHSLVNNGLDVRDSAMPTLLAYEIFLTPKIHVPYRLALISYACRTSQYLLPTTIATG